MCAKHDILQQNDYYRTGKIELTSSRLELCLALLLANICVRSPHTPAPVSAPGHSLGSLPLFAVVPAAQSVLQLHHLVALLFLPPDSACAFCSPPFHPAVVALAAAVAVVAAAFAAAPAAGSSLGL